MKHRTVITCTLLLAVWAGTLCAQNILTPSRDLQLNLDEAIEEVSEGVAATEPLKRHLDESLAELNAAIAKVKNDPNALNQSEFEVAFAKAMNKVIRDMDEALGYQDQTLWAFQDITAEVVRVAKRLDHNYNLANEQAQRQTAKLKALEAELDKMAREIERKGKNATPEMKAKFRQKLMQFRIMSRTVKNQKAVAEQLSKTLSFLGKNGENISTGVQNLQFFFESLKANREAFRQLAESREQMANLAILMKSGGAASLSANFAKLRTINQRLIDFGNTFDAIGQNLENLNSFDPQSMQFEVEDLGPDAEPWKDWLSREAN